MCRLSSGLILGGITYVYRLFYLVPPQEQGDILPLAEAGPASGLMVVEEVTKPMGVEKSQRVVLRAVADQADEIPFFQLQQGLPDARIEPRAPFKEIGRLCAEAAFGEGIALRGRQVGKLSIGDLPGCKPHEPIHLRLGDMAAEWGQHPIPAEQHLPGGIPQGPVQIEQNSFPFRIHSAPPFHYRYCT